MLFGALPPYQGNTHQMCGSIIEKKFIYGQFFLPHKIVGYLRLFLSCIFDWMYKYQTYLLQKNKIIESNQYRYLFHSKFKFQGTKLYVQLYYLLCFLFIFVSKFKFKIAFYRYCVVSSHMYVLFLRKRTNRIETAYTIYYYNSWLLLLYSFKMRKKQVKQKTH